MNLTKANSSQFEIPWEMQYPVELFKNVPFISGMLDGRVARFIFDSGAQDILLNSIYLEHPEKSESGGISGFIGATTTFYSRIGALEFGAWKIRNVETMAADLSRTEQKYGTRIDGIIGFRHLIAFDWMVDYAAKRLHIWKRVRDVDLNIRAKLRTQYLFHFPRFEARIDGRDYKFVLDTGAWMLVLDEKHKQVLSGVLRDLHKVEMTGGSGTTETSIEATLSKIEIGEMEFTDALVWFKDLSHLTTRFGEFDGIIGYPILGKVRTVVTWDRRGMIFLAD